MCGALKTVEVVHEHVCMQNWSHIEVTKGRKKGKAPRLDHM
jgi:hypothetical protein